MPIITTNVIDIKEEKLINNVIKLILKTTITIPV